MTLFKTETCETKGGLTTTTVLLGKIDKEFVKNLASITTKGTEEGSVTIHDNKTVLIIRFEQLVKRFSMELVVTEIERGVNGLEGFKVDVHFLLFTIIRHNSTRVHDKTIRRNLVVKLQPLLSRSDSREHRKPIDTRLDIGRGTVLITKHLLNTRNLILRRHNQTNHTGTITTGSFKGFNKPLDLPHLNIFISLIGRHFVDCLKKKQKGDCIYLAALSAQKIRTISESLNYYC
mmetsp:Transcript_9829/g.18360  ORF Transcript_9829/g.18360 Transcript_9829/m.18360 type:complete len:233 (+) Transcript_9829:1300-1998(+)